MSEIESPKDYIDFHIELSRGDKLTGTDRQQYIINIAKEIKGIEDGVIRNDLLKIISEKLAVEEHDLIRTINTQRVNVENYQEEDGSITVPEALRPYMGGLEVIAKK